MNFLPSFRGWVFSPLNLEPVFFEPSLRSPECCGAQRPGNWPCSSPGANEIRREAQWFLAGDGLHQPWERRDRVTWLAASWAGWSDGSFHTECAIWRSVECGSLCQNPRQMEQVNYFCSVFFSCDPLRLRFCSFFSWVHLFLYGTQ